MKWRRSRLCVGLVIWISLVEKGWDFRCPGPRLSWGIAPPFTEMVLPVIGVAFRCELYYT